MVLPRQGNTITMRLVIGLPTRKFFGNPASQIKTAIFGEQNGDFLKINYFQRWFFA